METTRSSAYKLGRYTILPKVIELAKNSGMEVFILREVSKPIIETEIPLEFREVFVPFAQKPGGEKFVQAVKWFLSLAAKDSDELENLGSGKFKVKPNLTNQTDSPSDIELENQLELAIETALDEGDQEAGEFEGWIYAFSFPTIVKSNEPFPIKIGKTTQDVETRVYTQCKSSACFEKPVILGKWPVNRVGPTESAIHNILKANNQWLEEAPGTEWFFTTPQKVEQIINTIPNLA